MGMEIDVLPKWERKLYWIGGIGCMLYCFFSFYKAGQENLENFEETQPGMSLLGGIKDASDHEWLNAQVNLPILIPLLAGHLLIGHFLFAMNVKVQHQKSIRLFYDLLAVTSVLGTKVSLLFVVESCIMFLLTFQRHISLVWFTSLSLTTSLNVNWIIVQQMSYAKVMDDVTFIITISYTHMRLTSACIDIIKHKNVEQNLHTASNKVSTIDSDSPSNVPNNQGKKTNLGQLDSHIDETSLIDFMLYIFYLPLFFYGPLLPFDEFQSQLATFYRSPRLSYDLKYIAKNLTRVIVWVIFYEVQCHFFFVMSATVYDDSSIVASFTVPAAIGLCVWQGCLFQAKYVCLWGFFSLLSSLDGLAPTPLPICICLVYSFTDMWKYFDVGLHKYIMKYIYIPCGGSRAGLFRQFLGTSLSFFYIFLWHGVEMNHFVWCCGNFVVIIAEIVGLRFECSELGLKLQSILGPAAVLRFKAAISVPFYLASALQVMFFFFNYDTGVILTNKLVFEADWTCLFYEFVGFYLCIQNAMHVRKFGLHRLKFKKV